MRTMPGASTRPGFAQVRRIEGIALAAKKPRMPMGTLM